MKATKIALGMAAFVMMGLLVGGNESSRAAAPTVYPIMDISSGYLLGGSAGGKWVKPAVVAGAVKGGEKYRIYGPVGYLGQGVGGKAESIGVPCEETFQVGMTASFKTDTAIATSGSWPAMPRLPRSLSTNQAVYIKAVSDLLKQKGIAAPHVKIDQLWRVDLEGDKVDEVLISASYHADAQDNSPIPSVEAGDYSIVFMRKVVKGTVQTVMLASDVQLKKIDFSAPITYRIENVLDLNGDGVMEVVVHGEYYEGSWGSVFQVKGTQVEEVLTDGCGV